MPPRDPSKSAMFERLHGSYRQRDARIDAAREFKEAIDVETGQLLYQPRVGRGPTWKRNTTGLSIHDFLFASRHAYQDIRDDLAQTRDEKLKAMQSKSHTSEASRHLVMRMQVSIKPL